MEARTRSGLLPTDIMSMIGHATAVRQCDAIFAAEARDVRILAVCMNSDGIPCVGLTTTPFVCPEGWTVSHVLAVTEFHPTYSAHMVVQDISYGVVPRVLRHRQVSGIFSLSGHTSRSFSEGNLSMDEDGSVHTNDFATCPACIQLQVGISPSSLLAFIHSTIHTLPLDILQASGASNAGGSLAIHDTIVSVLELADIPKKPYEGWGRRWDPLSLMITRPKHLNFEYSVSAATTNSKHDALNYLYVLCKIHKF